MTAEWTCIVFSATAFIIGAFCVFLNVKFLYWKKRGIPCLEPKFPLGNLADILTRRKNMGEAYADVYRKMEGMNFAGVFLMHRPQFIIRSPELIRKCLLTDFKHFHDHGFVYDEKIDPLTGGQPGLSMDQITAQVIVFFMGGFETTSATISFCLYELAKNTNIQKCLMTEIDRILEEYGGQITYDGVKEMKYLDQVVSETLRKYPPLTFLSRICNKDYTIPETNLVVEKGIQVVIPVLGLHRDPKYFPDPERFKPERFSDEAKRHRPNYVYLPFGEGQRICIGRNFGLMQTKVGLVCLLSKYKFQTCKKTPDSLKIDPTKFIMAPIEGVWLKVTSRDCLDC